MKTKTILNVLIAILLCVSSFGSVVSAQDSPGTDDIHSVNISVENEENDEQHMTITVALAWDYPAQFSNNLNIESDGVDGISGDEANDYGLQLEGMTLDELQDEHKSHVWDMSFGGAGSSTGGGGSAAWDIATTLDKEALINESGLHDGFGVTITLTMDMNAADLTTPDVTMTFGPVGDKEGTGLELPPWQTAVSVTDGLNWCNTNLSNDGTENSLESDFAYRADDEFDFTATFGQDCDGKDGGDDDKDGVPNDNDDCPGTASGVTVDPDTGCPVDQGCTEGTDSDGDGVDDCFDTCADTADGASVDGDGCSEAQLPDETEDWTFNVTFTVADASYTCAGMDNTSSAADCMTAADVTLPAVADVAAGHPHAWAWELQVAGSAAADQDPANMLLTSQSTFAWVATGCTGDCLTSTVHTVTNLSGALEIASGDCVYFDGVTPVFGDAWDDLSQSSRCFDAEGTYTSGDYTITVGAAATNGTGTGPIGEETKTDEEATPGFGLIAGVSAALGAALIAASRHED